MSTTSQTCGIPELGPGAFRRAGASARPRRVTYGLAVASFAAILASCGVEPAGHTGDGEAVAAAAPASHVQHDHESTLSLLSEARLANAAYQDVTAAESAGYESSIDTLGCFQNPEQGGMGVHYINQSLLDGQVDVHHPEALVYELGADGEIVGLVAHEYIVPIEAWTSAQPPRLFGRAFHRHPTLPLWVLHAWLWKPNGEGMFVDWNPAVRLCPAGVPVFGRDLPAS